MTHTSRSIGHLKSFVQKTSSWRRETLDGRSYIVARVVILVEGVHNGSAGPLYYSRDVIESSAHLWNGVPITNNHPTRSDGTPISANSPDVVQAVGIGHLYDTWYDANEGKLRADAWVDEDKARRVAPEALDALMSNQQLEVSTGDFFIDDGQAGTWRGESYDASVAIMFPDHLALLPHDTGACSWDDGCGVRVNTKGTGMKKPNLITSAIEFFAKLADKAKEEWSENGDDPKPADDCTCNDPMALLEEAGIKGSRAGKFALKQLTLAALELSHGETHQKLQEAVDRLDNDTWMHFVVDVYDSFLIYKAIGSNPTELGTSNRVTRLWKVSYSIAEDQGTVTLADDAQEVREEREFVPVGDGPAQNAQEETMKTKDQVIDALIASEKNELAETDRGWLKAMSEDRLAKLTANTEEAPEPPVEEEPTEKGAEAEGASPEEEEGKGKEGEEEEPAKQSAPSIDEYIENAPPEIGAVLKDFANAHRTEKSRLIKAIMSNESNKFSEEDLATKKIDDLRNIAALAKVTPLREDFSLGAGGSDAHNTDDGYMPSPWEEKKTG